jgi:hypothetical protein
MSGMFLTDELPMNPKEALSDTPETTAQVLRRFRVVFNAVRSNFQQLEKQMGLRSGL